MFFCHLAEVFESISHATSRTIITVQLADLFKQLSPDELSIVCNLALGQLYPTYIPTQFAIASKTMIKIVAHLCAVAEPEIIQATKKQGDIGDVIMTYTWQGSGKLSITAVYNSLVSLEKISGTGSHEGKITHLRTLLAMLTPLEAKYIARIILGKLRLGFSDMTIIDALSWMVTDNKSLHSTIEDAYNICADIGLIARTLKSNGVQDLEAMKIHVGIPIRPAAAERLPSAQAIIEKIGPCVAEPKLDGLRLQVHIATQQDGSKHIQFFSRNIQDMSHMFPDLVEAFKTLAIETLVCEGEAISFDQNTGSFLPFQETAKRRRKHDISEIMQEFPLQLFLFDLLYYNGTSYLAMPLHTRRAQLRSIVDSLQSEIIKNTEERAITTAQELETYLAETIAAGLEGLVIKKPDAPYQPGKRNFNWIKLKMHSEGSLEDTIDCVVLGYYKGQGRRTTLGIGALLVGVYNKAKDCFQTIAKIGTGLNDDGWEDIKKQCDNIQCTDIPHNVECNRQLMPDVCTEPRIVCQIRADEITLSPLHTACKTDAVSGFALRFPRFMGYRTDKGPYEATSSQEIQRMYNDQFSTR
jgi:DNA ligase-1